NAENVRNLFFWESGSSTWPLVLQQAIEKEVQLQALEDLAAVACVQVDPIEPAEYQVHEYIDVKKGTTLRFPNKAPYSLVRCGVFTKKGIAYQGSVACIYPDTIDAKVKAPEQSSPGDEIEVEIAVQVRGQEREPVKCLLMIMDSRIERNKDDIRAGKQLFAHLRQEQSPWNNGEVESRESIRKRREEEERRRAEEDRRRTAAGPPRLFQRAVGGTGDDGSPEAEPAELDLDAAPPQPKKYAMKEKSKPSPAAAPPSRAMPVMASINVISAVAAPGPAPVPPSTTTPGQAAPSKVSQIPSKAGTSQLQDVLLEIPEASIVTALRQEEQVILVGLLDVTPGRALKTKVMLGEQVCTWRVEAIFFRGVDIAVSKVYIEAKLEQFVEVHVPSFLEPKDKCSALVTYQVTGPAVIRAETYQNVQEFKVDGQGVLQLPLTGPTEVIVELERGGSVIDRVQKSVAKIGTEKVTVSQISQGQPGQVFEGDQVLVYPSPGFMLVEGMKALVQYPYGCAEQTSCKMCGLITAWKAGDQGAVPLSPADVQDIKDKLVIGINRMGLFFRETAKGGEFSLWENGTPSPDVSAKVLKNLAKLRDVDLPEAVPLKQMLEKAAHSLIEAKVKNADLLEYNPAFGPGEIECVEDAARYLLAPDPKFHAPAIEYLKEHVEETDTSVSWEGKRSWCGAVEATCYALAGLVRSGAASPYIDKGLAFIGKHMINGRLHSTSDTVAMLEFFAELAKQQGPGKSDAKVKRVAVIDGKEVVLDKVPVSGKKVELKATAFVRVDKRSTIDYTQASSAFKFDVKLSSTNLVLGDRAQVTITPKESSICPIAHVYLPGNVAAIESGTNIQLIVSPLKQESLALDVIAVRTGTCQMRVLLRDMYDEEKLGCTLPMKVTVNAPKQ
nr:hypothetical protein [Candidatus Sigynarchaeota archaeon]